MVTKFGKTWWGDAWLQSLTSIDYANRIPRGARYARNGSVMKIKIDGNTITAQVQGRRIRPYKVTLQVDTFSQEEIDRFVDGILQHPAIVAELLNRKLSPAVLDIARAQRLRVFPHSWRDLKMSCSCPDWAVPCKHIAAVIYKTGQEIDNNPFIIFELHGVDIVGELSKRGVALNHGKAIALSPWAEAMQLMPLSKVKAEPAPAELQQFDYSTIATLGDAMGRLLPASPAFYADGDFKTIYSGNLRRAARAVAPVLSGRYELTAALGTTVGWIPKEVQGQVRVVVDAERIVQVYFDQAKRASKPVDLMEYLFDLPAEQLAGVSNVVHGLRACCLLALHLAAKGNVCPVVSQEKDGATRVDWAPYTGDQATAAILQSADAYLAPGSVVFMQGVRRKLAPQHPAWFMTTCFLSCIMRCTAKVPAIFSKVDSIFFTGQALKFDGVGELGIPGGIKSWTDHLSTPQLRYMPVVIVSDKKKDGTEFCLDLAVSDTERDEADVPLGEVFANPDYAATRYGILRDVALLSPLLSGIDTYLAREAQQPIKMDNESFTSFLIDVIPAMRLLHIKVLLPKSLQRLLHPRPTVSLSTSGAIGVAGVRLDQLLQFDWKIAIGDQLISLEEYQALLSRAQGLVRYKQEYIYVTSDDLKRIGKAIASHTEMTPSRMLQVALSGEYKGAQVEISPQVKALVKRLTAPADLPVPPEINATLRPYQKRGYEWMCHNMQLGFGSILADDMGLGKTLQVITLLQKLKDDHMLDKAGAIVVAPTGLLANWQAELQRFAPSLSVFLYHGSVRDFKAYGHDILLTSYGLVRSDIELLRKHKWAVVVIDEAQNIKNSATAQSKAVRALKAPTLIAMSGTPVENRLSEYWSIMDFANKGYLGSLKSFNEEYARPIQIEGDEARASLFRRITAPMMMRRLKTDKSIISDLPDKIEQDEYAMLTPQQAAIYQQVLNESMRAIEGIDQNDSSQLFKRKGLVLQMMLALKQICNHPAQYLKNGDLTPSFSGKTQMLLDLVSSIDESGEKAIIFTQFKEMGDMLVRFITEALGSEPMFLHGGCSLKQRNDMVDRFQHNRADRFFVLSLKAAGTGLNLTAATHVIHYDLWWNPAVEAQATDRAYRIGQKQNVMVHRFITKNTFEERINDMINSKRDLADLTVAKGESWIGKLSNKQLREIFG